MAARKYFGYARHASFSVIALPYADEDLQLVIFLPEPGKSLSTVEHQLDPKLFKECSKVDRQKIALFLPRFKLEPPTWTLGRTLSGLGMSSAFDSPKGSADFDGMVPRSSADYLSISEVFHKCFVEVNEEGTEAAAATVAIVRVGSAAPTTLPPEIHVDRPFLFAIQHRPSGACLFLGRVVDPSK